MLKFFNIFLKYEEAQENYVEPAKNSENILQSIIKYELFLINSDNQQILKHFEITRK